MFIFIYVIKHTFSPYRVFMNYFNCFFHPIYSDNIKVAFNSIYIAPEECIRSRQSFEGPEAPKRIAFVAVIFLRNRLTFKRIALALYFTIFYQTKTFNFSDGFFSKFSTHFYESKSTAIFVSVSFIGNLGTILFVNM